MPVFGVWMWPDSLAASSAEQTAARCARIGVTDIYFLTKGLAGTVSYTGGTAPAAGPRNLLRELLDSAHSRGIRVHAWLTSASDEHYKALHPESGRCHYTRGRDKGLISLRDEGYLEYMRRVVREVCGYEIDGLHLDYIRYNHLLYGWDEADQRRYAAGGADIPHLRELMDRTFFSEGGEENACIFDALRDGDESARALARVRREDVAAFARAVTAAARAENSRLLLSAALMPEGAYADTAFADLHYGQSYADAAELYDYVIPMAYSQAYSQDEQWVKTVARGTLQKGLRTVVGVQAYEGGTGDTLRKDLAALEGLPVDGACLFRYGAFAAAWQEGAELRILNPTDEPVTALEAGGREIPLREPVQPGTEARIAFPRTADGLRAFREEKECPVFLVPSASEGGTQQ